MKPNLKQGWITLVIIFVFLFTSCAQEEIEEGKLGSPTMAIEEKVLPPEPLPVADNESKENELLPPPEKPPIKIAWQQLPSPPGGGYWDLAISSSDSDTVYVGTRDFNVLKSSDAGKTWTILGEKLFGAHIFSNIVVHPTNPNKIYLSNGVVYTTDEGIIWKKFRGGIESGEMEDVTSLALDPQHPETIYAGDRNYVYQSVDSGKNWKQLSDPGLAVNKVRQIIVDTTTPSTIYILVDNRGILKSKDSGLTWTEKNSGIDQPTGSYYLELDPKNSDVLYVANDAGIYKTITGGNSWQKLFFSSPGNSPLTISVGSDSKTIFITATDKKVYKSTDAGNTWKEVLTAEDIQSHHGYNFAVEISPKNSEVVYAATDKKIVKSIDGGATWLTMSDKIYDDSVFVVNYAQDTKELWVGNFWTRGIFTTDNDGQTWNFLEQWRSGPPADHYPMGIEIDPFDSKKVFVSGVSGLKLTEDDGETWKALGEGTYLDDSHVHGLKMDPNNPLVLFAGTAPGWDQENPVAKIFLTTDGGKTWQEKKGDFPQNMENNVYAFSISKSNSKILYATVNGHESDQEPHPHPLGIWKSTDGGGTWTDSNTNLPLKNTFSVAVHPENPPRVYVGLGHEEQFSYHGNEGLYETENGGKSWEKVKGLPNVQPSKIRFHPQKPQIVLVSYGEHICGACAGGIDKDENKYPRGAGVYGTIDGDNWYNLVPEGTFSGRQMAVMDLIFKDENTIYIGTDDGIFKGMVEIE